MGEKQEKKKPQSEIKPLVLSIIGVGDSMSGKTAMIICKKIK